MYPIKTISMLMKCLISDVPIYRKIFNVELRIPRVEIFKKSLLELWADTGTGMYYTKMNKDAIAHYVEVKAQEAAELKELDRLATLAKNANSATNTSNATH